MVKLGVQDLDVAGKRVLVRVDFNVPLDVSGNITDDTRIRAALPTIESILTRGGRPILLSHLGRPKGKGDPKLSLQPCADRLAELLHQPVTMDPAGKGVVLLENLRFNPAETKPETDPGFAKELAALGDVYVNDAFGTAHRAHSSVVALAHEFPGKAAAGLLLQKEIAFLGDTLLNPKRPFVAIIGGAKVSTKLGVLKALSKKVDHLLVGGGMAYTFLKAQGLEIGKSLLERELLATTREILASCPNLLLPLDVRVAREIVAGSPSRIVRVADGIRDDQMGLDVGPETLAHWQPLIEGAATILWNGPLGVFEIPDFATGTQQMAEMVAKANATTIIGGGDSVAAVKGAGLADRMSHISTGGGASLEYIEKGTLPGVEALSDLK